MTQLDSVERNLLLGILALQNGLLDQVDLIAAFQEWSKDRSRPLVRVLVDRGALAGSDGGSWRTWPAATSRGTAEIPSGAWPLSERRLRSPRACAGPPSRR